MASSGASSTPASPVNLTTAAGSPVLANKLLAGDANPAFEIDGNGTVRWGPGGGTPLSNALYNDSAGFGGEGVHVTEQFYVDGSAFSAHSVEANANQANMVRIGTIGGNSGISFQNDEAASNLYRSAAGTLKTDGALGVVGLLDCHSNVYFGNGPYGVGVLSGANEGRMTFPAGELNLGGGTDTQTIRLATGKVGFYAHAPVVQPAAPVTLADVIAIIRGCGLSA